MSSSLAGLSQAGVAATVETDTTVQAFAQWLTEMKARSSRTLQEMLSEMSIIRDGITSNSVELADFKRHSTGISQQMQSQLTDLREKLTNAFGEITSLVKQKTVSDQEMMQDINSLQGNLSCKTAEIENLKRSYSQAHQQLNNSLIQITNHLAVTKKEVATATDTCDRVANDTNQRLGEVDSNLRGLEDVLSVGNAEHRSQMLQLQEEIARIHESLASVSAEFLDHKRATNSVHNKLQSQVWSLEEGRRRQQPFLQAEAQAVAKAEAAALTQGMPTRAAEVIKSETTISTQPPAAQPVFASAAHATPPQSLSAVPTVAATEVAGGATSFFGAGYPMLHQISQPAGSAQVAETVTLRGVSMPCYTETHLSGMHPGKLRDHAVLLFRLLGAEAIGSGVPAQDRELLEWVSRIHKIHVEPLRVTFPDLAVLAGEAPRWSRPASLLPTQPYGVPAPSNVQQAQVITPGMPTRVMARPAVGVTSPLALR